jgi:hypothetical protein
MIVEERDYTLKPGKLGAFVETYRDHGLQIQLDYLGAFHGYFTSEIGELNHVVAWWSYAGLDDRQARRARMSAEPMSTKSSTSSHCRTRGILQPTAFSPLR